MGSSKVIEAEFVTVQSKRSHELKQLHDRISDDPSILDKLDKLNEPDFALIGKLIQLYTIIDINSRITIRLLRIITDGIDDTFADKLSEADVIVQLRKYATKLKTQTNLKEGIERAVENLDMHRQHRHTFAHWVVRRLPGEEAFIVLTKSSGDLKKRGLEAPEPDKCIWGIFMISHLKDELENIIGHCDYISQSAAYLYSDFDQIKSAESTISSQ